MENFIVKKIEDYNKINIDKCVSWMYDWWGKKDGWSRKKVTTYLKSSFNKNRLPITFIAFDKNNNEVGICQITLKDLDCRPDIYPYIANLYIDEKHRNKGIVKLLLDEAIRTAKEFNLTILYLYTTHIGLYEKYGWEFVDNIETYLTPHIQRLYKYELL